MKIAILTTDSREHYGDYTNPRPYFGAAPEALLQGFAAMPEAEVHVVSCLQQPVQSPQQIAPNIFYHSVTVPKLGWMRTLYQGCVRATRKKLREIEPDIVHGQGTERDCALAAVGSGFPNVLTIHGNMRAIAKINGAKIGSFFWLAEKLETRTLKKTSGVFCNSAYTESLVAARTGQTWRVPNALRQAFFEVPPARNKTGIPSLLNVGVIQPRKQQLELELLAAAKNLHRKGLKFALHFVGETAPATRYGASFAQQLADAEKAGYARHLGQLTSSQLLAVMDAATALVHFPSEEAFGLVVAEALARNLKFFGARVGGIVDITQEVEGAELFEAGNFAALEDGLERWLKADGPPATGGAESMRHHFHPQIIARRHLEIYREVLAKT